MITLGQAREYLEALGITLPDFVVEALLEVIAAVTPCLAEHYPPAVQRLIRLYLLSLLSFVQADQYVSSQTAPSGASQSFRHRGFADRWRGTVAALQALDTAGCTTELVPDDPTAAHAGLWVSTGPCKGGC